MYSRHTVTDFSHVKYDEIKQTPDVTIPEEGQSSRRATPTYIVS